MTIRPRRSVLYMPGSNPRALDKAKTLAADGLILDLEDAVAPDHKEAARRAVVAAVKAGGYGPREVVIRVNGLASAWGFADLEAAATGGADAVLLPKVESADAVRQALAMLGGAGAPAVVHDGNAARHASGRGDRGGRPAARERSPAGRPRLSRGLFA